MNSAINSSLQGMQSNQQDLVKHADSISRMGLMEPGETEGHPSDDLAQELVGVMQAQRGFEANIPVLRVADEMLGSLLDVFA